jgi:hypothetical protein
MNRLLTVLLTGATIAGAATTIPSVAHAGDGDIAAGLIGGIAAGALLGAVTAPRPDPYYAPVYAPPPAYPVVSCYWTRGEPYWNGYRWLRPRVQVCD